MPGSFVTRALAPADEPRWRELHRGYTDFYDVTTTEGQRDRLWEWVIGHEYGLEGLVVEQGAGDGGQVVGIAHVRPVVRPLHVSVDGYLDDLFVDPTVRGAGAAAALFDAIRRLGRERGWGAVRWLTGESNARARAFYAKQGAAALPFVTYGLDLPPEPPPGG